MRNSRESGIERLTTRYMPLQNRDDAQRADEKDVEIARLHRVIADLDEERDRLTGELDKSAETIALLRQGEASQRQSVSKVEASATFAQKEVLRLVGLLDGRDREIVSLKRQLEAEAARNREASDIAMAARHELVCAAEDLAAMTRENQVGTPKELCVVAVVPSSLHSFCFV